MQARGFTEVAHVGPQFRMTNWSHDPPEQQMAAQKAYHFFVNRFAAHEIFTVRDYYTLKELQADKSLARLRGKHGLSHRPLHWKKSIQITTPAHMIYDRANDYPEAENSAFIGSTRRMLSRKKNFAARPCSILERLLTRSTNVCSTRHGSRKLRVFLVAKALLVSHRKSAK